MNKSKNEYKDVYTSGTAYNIIYYYDSTNIFANFLFLL